MANAYDSCATKIQKLAHYIWNKLLRTDSVDSVHRQAKDELTEFFCVLSRDFFEERS